MGKVFRRTCSDLDFRIWPDAGDLSKVEYLIAWQVPQELLAELPRLRVLFSSGAGIDHVDLSAVPAHIPIVRMVEQGIINGMVEYVSLRAGSAPRLFDYVSAQAARVWSALEVPPASTRTVGVMGMGVLGRAVLERLATYDFRLRGWNRSVRLMQGVESFAGSDQLQRFLKGCDVLVCLLPLTSSTKGVLNHKVFSALPAGAAVINVGRGPHLVDADLLDALNSGRLSRAILDVTDPEPLPREHPFWTHPRVFLTPHVASMTQPRAPHRSC